jgi:hypothetical protein
VAVTATTGIAAEPLHGTTLHRLLSKRSCNSCASDHDLGTQASQHMQLPSRAFAALRSLMVVPADCGVPKVVGDFRKMWPRRDVLRRLDALIIDEVSKLTASQDGHSGGHSELGTAMTSVLG